MGEGKNRHSSKQPNERVKASPASSEPRTVKLAAVNGTRMPRSATRRFHPLTRLLSLVGLGLGNHCHRLHPARQARICGPCCVVPAPTAHGSAANPMPTGQVHLGLVAFRLSLVTPAGVTTARIKTADPFKKTPGEPGPSKITVAIKWRIAAQITFAALVRRVTGWWW